MRCFGVDNPTAVHHALLALARVLARQAAAECFRTLRTTATKQKED